MDTAPLASKLLLPAALVPLVALTLWSHEEARFARTSFPTASDTLYMPPTSLLRASALGHRELAADLMWVKSIIYYGEQLTNHGQFGALDRHIDALISLDPKFHTVYKWAGTVTMYRTGQIPTSAVRSSIRYLEAGLEAFPRDWELAFMLGCDYLFELRSNDPEITRRWRSTGATYIERAALLGGGPPWLATLAASMRTKAGEKEAAIRYLEQAYLVTEDAKVREQIEGKLRSLRGDMDGLESAAQDFDRRWQADLPYVPADLFLILSTNGSAELARGTRAEPPTIKQLIGQLTRAPANELLDSSESSFAAATAKTPIPAEPTPALAVPMKEDHHESPVGR